MTTDAPNADRHATTTANVDATVSAESREKARSVVSPVDEPIALTTPPPVPAQGAAVEHQADVATATNAVTVMPGNSTRNADEIQSVSPEGRPADPKVGPAGIRGIMVAMVVAVLAACSIATIWVGWYALPIAGFIIAIICINPALWAARDRAHDRRRVIKHRIDEGELVATSNNGHPKVQR